MQIALLGNYPPKSCGIATFTNSLLRALDANLTADRLTDFAEVIAIEDAGQHHDYPAEVGEVLPRDDRAAYRRLAARLNAGDHDLLIVQHEYGIFGGADGDYLLELTDRLEIPLLVTCHTVLRDPSPGQRSVLRRLCARAGVMVVMSEMARRFLTEVFGCRPEKIRVIEHGVPVIEMAGRAALREQLGWKNRRVLFTFGLLGRGKGIETVIRALPAIVAEHPETLYVVLGKTHPNVVRDHGEEYREWLHELAAELGVADNLQMIAEFATEQRLFECLRATDLYVTPYPNEAQITSGTLAYAVGAGAAVVSTPFWHATELLSEGRGHLFPFHDHNRLAKVCLNLLADDAAMADTRARALAHGKTIMWPAIGAEYIRNFADARLASQEPNLAPATPPSPKEAARLNLPTTLPRLRIDHLRRLTDDCGLIQHAKYAVPNRHEGYCLDDNGRALVFTCAVLQGDLIPENRRTLIQLTERYLSYCFHAQNEDGSLRNFMGYGRNFLEEKGSEDSYARALWGLAACVARPPRPDLAELANECFIRAVGYLDQTASPRAIAYGIIALADYLAARPTNDLRNLMDRCVSRLLDHYRDSAEEDSGWAWFEASLTYDNAILPLALYRSLTIIDRPEARRVARAATRFLAGHTFVGGRARPVGCHRACERHGSPEQFDQQPLEAMATVLLHTEAFRQDRNDDDARLARLAFAWFLGHNDLDAPLYDQTTAGCYDGLTAVGPNQNQGAESLLAYLIARVAVAELPNQPLDPARPTAASREEILGDMLNGYTPEWVKQPAAGVTPVRRRETIVSATALGQYDQITADGRPTGLRAGWERPGRRE